MLPQITSVVVTSFAALMLSKCTAIMLDMFSANVTWIDRLHFFHNCVGIDTMKNAPSVAGKYSENEPKGRCSDKFKLLNNHYGQIPVVDLLKIHSVLLPHRDDLYPIETERGQNQHEHGEDLNRVE